MFINNQLFLHYLGLLSHPDERQRTDCLQDLFFFLLKGGLIHPNQWRDITPALMRNMDPQCDATLRRWSYQVASFCLSDPSLIEFLVNNIEREENSENRSWIVAILSRNLSHNDLEKTLRKKDIGLSSEQIMLSSYLYSDAAPFDPKQIINSGDPLSLMWIASIGAYKNIAEAAKKDPIVSSRELSLLTSSTDNDEVLKHVMYAFNLQKSFTVNELLFDPSDYKSMGDQQKKWFFTLIWKDPIFLKKNIDLFRDILSDRHLFVELNNEVRIGIARGLESGPFLLELAPLIANWYSHEQTPSSQNMLLKHMLKNSNKYDDYKSIIEYQKLNGDASIKELIRVEQGAQRSQRKTTVIVPDFSSNKKSGKSPIDLQKKKEPDLVSKNITEGRSNKMMTIPSFKIGVTFCGEYRDKYVQPFCEALIKHDGFSKKNIFYDAWHEHLINGPEGDQTLRKIYFQNCQLIVVLLSPNYSEKKWTRYIEWPAIKELINSGESSKICLLRVDKAEISRVGGLWTTQAIVKDIDNLSPDEIANFILNKWRFVKNSK